MYYRRQLKLALKGDDFEALHEALAKVRSTSKTVTVNREALAALLIDYSNLINDRELV